MNPGFFEMLKFAVLVLLVGIVAGLGAIFFRELIALFHNLLFYGQFSVNYNALQHALPSKWGVGIVFVPVLGALLVFFSPLLFIGATLGGAFAGFCDINIQLGALAGMAGMVGASTGAPITAIIMIAELTNDFSILLPLMIIVAIAYLVRRLLMKESVYTLKLKRRGHIIPDKLESPHQVML